MELTDVLDERELFRRPLDAPPISYEEYRQLPESNVHVEIVDGIIIVTASAIGRHQLVIMRLGRILADAAPVGYEAVPEWDWVLSREPLNVRRPDLAVVTRAQVDAPHLSDAPLLAVEILSPGGRERDLVTKRREYGAAGLPAYWVVELERPEIAVFARHQDTLELVASAHGTEPLDVAEPFPVRVVPADLIS